MDNVCNLKWTYLLEDLEVVDLEMVVPPGTSFTSVPYRVTITRGQGLKDLIDSEIVGITSKNDGLGLWTITRGLEGTTVRKHNAGELVVANFTAGLFQQLQSSMMGMYAHWALAFGIERSGVIRESFNPTLELQVTHKTGLTVTVAPGYGFIERVPYTLSEATDVLLTLPVSNPYIALIQAFNDTVTVKYGAEATTPSAPDPDENAMALAEVLLLTDTTEATDITDRRSFY